MPSMRVDRFASCENIVSRFQTSLILPSPSPPPPNWSLNPIEENLLQPLLKSFVTVFIRYNEGLENKLTRAPLLGWTKSTYYRVRNQL